MSRTELRWTNKETYSSQSSPTTGSLSSHPEETSCRISAVRGQTPACFATPGSCASISRGSWLSVTNRTREYSSSTSQTLIHVRAIAIAS